MRPPTVVKSATNTRKKERERETNVQLFAHEMLQLFGGGNSLQVVTCCPTLANGLIMVYCFDF